MRKLSKMSSNIFTTKLHDVIITKGLDDDANAKEGLFLVMDYVESDVRKVLDSVKYGTNLKEDHIIIILYNILCSLQFLHTANVIHRDIKPDNLLINSKCEISITDFGLSRSMIECDDEKSLYKRKQKMRSRMLDYSKQEIGRDQENYKSRMSTILTQSKSQKKERNLSDHMGSRWYRAPEIILTEKQYDQGIDMWPIGCILEELIYCSEPYTKDLT